MFSETKLDDGFSSTPYFVKSFPAPFRLVRNGLGDEIDFIFERVFHLS